MSLTRLRIMRPAVLLVLAFAVTAASNGRGQTPDYVVEVPVANMYSSATQDADVVSQAVLGTNVASIESRGDWVKVRTPDHYAGWMLLPTLRPVSGSSGYGIPGKVVQVQSLFANLYRETDVTTHQPVITVPFESRLEITNEGTGEDSDWLKVRLPDDRPAWIQRADVNLNPKLLTISESIELGRRFLGLPYLWGGRSSYGYDCSGFTQMLLRSRGINMPRDADLQAAWDGVVAVERKDLRAGDLLFFGPAHDKITHTAMYIGNGEFIHATTYDRPVIQISRLDEQPWTRILVACRRVK